MYEKSYVVAASLSLKAGKGTPHHNTKCDWSVILPSQDDSLNYKLWMIRILLIEGVAYKYKNEIGKGKN
jgi:hypothetical protein